MNSGSGSIPDRRDIKPELGWHSAAEGLFQRRWLLISACLLFFVNSCAKELPILEPADLPVSLVVEQLQQRRSHLSSFRAAGTLRVQGGKQRWSGKAFLLSQIPHSLRLEVVGLFGQTVLSLASDGAHFIIWEPGQNRAYQGLASNRTLATLIDIPLKDREVLLLLAGIVPPWNDAKAKLFRLPDSEGLVLQLEDFSGGLTQRIWLEGEELIVTRIERLQGNERELEAIFTDYVAVEGSLYPQSIEMEGAKIRLSLRYEQFSVNEPLDDSIFHLTLPERVEIHPW